MPTRSRAGARVSSVLVLVLLPALLAALVQGPATGLSAPVTTGDPAARPAARQAPPGTAGIGDPYWPYDGNRGIDVRHYDIRDSYDFTTGRLAGTTTLTVRATTRLSRFQLDLLLPTSAVTVDGVTAAFRRREPHELDITPATPIAKGARFTVRVTYSGRPSALGYAGEGNWLADSREVVTMNEPHMAPWWFASNDHPSDKATYDVTVTGPATHQVVSNGLLIGRTTDGPTATTHWRSVKPMAGYLAFFALGRYRIEHGTSNGLPWYVAVSKELDSTSQAVALRVLRGSPRVTAWLAGRLGTYPFESTGGLTTSLDVGFALENQTRPTYPRSFGSNSSVLVHELAHQWFGDSVSVRRWRDIWLNEGFATFMEAAYAERHGGQSAKRWLADEYDSATTYGTRTFWRLDLTDPGPRHVFDYPVYLRGGMALQALRNRIGEHDFWSLLHTWVKTRRYGNGSVEAFERLAEKVSHERLGGFFRAWLETPRPPRETAANGLA
ncbi:M1 family metallopeptidase [soil metagenome]